LSIFLLLIEAVRHFRSAAVKLIIDAACLFSDRLLDGSEELE